MPEVKDKQAESRLISRIKDARMDRERFAPWYDEFYDMAGPTKQRVTGSNIDTPRSADEQEDIFDATLQVASENYAADNMDEFTPPYRPWTKHEAVGEVSAGNAKRVNAFIQARMDMLYDTIRASTFQEASQEAYHDSAIGPFSVKVRHSQRGPIDVEYIPLSQLLIAPAPRHGTGLRGWERKIPERHLASIYPLVDWPDVLKKPRKEIGKTKKDHHVIECWELDFESEVEAWWGYLVVGSKVVWSTRQEGRGSCPIIVGRTRVSQPSAYGIGPAGMALPSSRTLQRLSFLELRRQGKIVDPPGVFSDPEGIFDPDRGFENGQWFEMGDGFEVKEMSPQSDMREVFFKVEDLRLEVRRALFQDKPDQRGLTPPSATQWMDQRTQQERRKTLQRAMMYREWVLPLIYRFEHIMENRGQIEQLRDDQGELIRIEPVSPLSRASDLDEVQLTQQLMAMVVGTFGEGALPYINIPETLSALKEKMGDRILSIRTDEEVQAAAIQAALSNLSASTKVASPIANGAGNGAAP